MSTTTATHTDQLGSRPIGPLLWHACSQTTLSVGVYGIYALTNAWFVARGVGATAMAAVNLVAPLLLALGAVSTALGVGAASVISRSLGAGDPAGAGRAAGTTFTVFWAAAITTTVVGLVALDPLLRMLGAHGPTLDYARDYAVIILAGAIMSTGFSSLVRAEGRMRFSTMLWIIPVLVQITLDPLFIFVLDLGARGAALGTVGGQAVSAAMSLWFFFLQRHRPYRVGLHDLRPRATVAGPLLGIGAPSFLAGFGATLLAVAVNTSLSASGGATALAAFAICARIQTFVVMPQLGISQGMQPIVGYNAGRRLLDRVQRTRTLALRATLTYGVLAAAAVALAAEPLAAAFVDEPDVQATAVDALRLIAIGFAAAGVTPLVSAYFQALGRPRPSYLLSLGTLLAIKLPLVLVLGHEMGTTGIWIAIAGGEVTSAIAATLVLHRASGHGLVGTSRSPRPIVDGVDGGDTG